MFLVISRSVSSVQTPSVPPNQEVFGDQNLFLLEKKKFFLNLTEAHIYFNFRMMYPTNDQCYTE